MTYTVKTFTAVDAASDAEEAAAYAAYPTDIVLVYRTDLAPPPPPVYEDLTAYTEVDPSGMLSEAASALTVTGLTRNVAAYLYKDFTAGHFTGNFTHNFEIKITGVGANYANVPAMALNNTLSEYNAVYTGSGNIQAIWLSSVPTNVPNINLHELCAGAQYNSAVFTPSLNTTYYCTFRRNTAVGTYGTLYLDIYSDAAHTSLITTLSLALHSTVAFRYLYPVQSVNTGSTSALSAVIQNLSLS